MLKGPTLVSAPTSTFDSPARPIPSLWRSYLISLATWGKRNTLKTQRCQVTTSFIKFVNVFANANPLSQVISQHVFWGVTQYIDNITCTHCLPGRYRKYNLFALIFGFRHKLFSTIVIQRKFWPELIDTFVFWVNGA